MLHRSSLYRYARNRHPSREKRLCWQIEDEENNAENADRPQIPDVLENNTVPSEVEDAIDDPTVPKTKGHKAELKVREAIEALGELSNAFTHPMTKQSIDMMESEQRAEWLKEKDFAEKEQHNLGGWKLITHEIGNFEEGNVHPRQFMYTITQFYKSRQGTFETTHDMQAVWQAHQEDIRNWDNLDEEAKKRIVDDFCDAAKIDDIVGHVNEGMSAYTSTSKEYKDKLLEARQEAEFLRQKAGGSGLFSVLGLEFYTIGQFIDAFKKIGSSYATAWEKRQQIAVNKLAKGIGGAATALDPFMGEEVFRSLREEVDSNNQQETNDEKDRHERDNTTWTVLFSERGGLIDKYISSGNNARARGVLEYAASRGWLYDLNQSAGRADKIILGRSLNTICSDWDQNLIDNYYNSLRSKNSGGASSEISKLKDQEDKNPHFDGFVRALNREMDDNNFWGAIGVMQAAVGRGKAGETGGIMASIFINKLRGPDGAKLRGYISDGVLDEAGRWTFGNTCFTLTNFILEKGDIYNWAKDGASNENMKNGGVLVNAIGAIEREILRHSEGRAMSRDDLNIAIGEVLSAKTVEFSTGSVSILDDIPEFNDYRSSKNMAIKYQTGLQDLKGQADYILGPSEMLISNYMSIFDVTSTDELNTRKEAEGFTAQILAKWDELNRLGKVGARKNFEQEMGGRLTRKMEEIVDSGKWSLVFSLEIEDNTNNKVPFLGALMARGLLKRSFLERKKDKNGVPENILSDATIKKVEQDTRSVRSRLPEIATIELRDGNQNDQGSGDPSETPAMQAI